MACNPIGKIEIVIYVSAKLVVQYLLGQDQVQCHREDLGLREEVEPK